MLDTNFREYLRSSGRPRTFLGPVYGPPAVRGPRRAFPEIKPRGEVP